MNIWNKLPAIMFQQRMQYIRSWNLTPPTLNKPTHILQFITLLLTVLESGQVYSGGGHIGYTEKLGMPNLLGSLEPREVRLLASAESLCGLWRTTEL